MKMCWILLLFALFLSITSHNAFSHPLHNNKPVVVVGTVFCDTCSQQQPSQSSHFISGAIVEVECRDEKTSKTSFKQQVRTNKHGKFRVVLPLSMQEHIDKIDTCSVKLIKSSDPFCSVPSSATSSPLKLKNSNNKNGARVFSAGFFALKPLKQPTSCNRKTDILKSKQVNPQFLFPPIVPPVIGPPSFLPPNPLQPAPLIPNPLQPPAPVIPNPFQPPAPLIPTIPMPPLPIITPPSPPPTLLPPFIPPFLPPIPGIPSGPPREKASTGVKQIP